MQEMYRKMVAAGEDMEDEGALGECTVFEE